MSMYHPHLVNGSLVDGPPSPSPTRSKKRKRSEEEEDCNTPTKTRTRPVSSQTLGLPTPDEKGSRLLFQENAQLVGTLLTDVANKSNLPFDNSRSVAAGHLGLERDERKESIQSQQMTPPSSVSPSAWPNLPTLHEGSPSRTRASTAVNKMNVPLPKLMLSMPFLLIQPPNTPSHATSLEASVLALRRILTLHTSNSTIQLLTQEQECYAWVMFAELGMQVVTSLTPEDGSLPRTEITTSGRPSPAKVHTLKALSIPPWAPNPGEMETAISRALRLADQVASLRPLRHNLTMLHVQLVCLQDNHKHAKVLLKRLLPLSTNAQPIASEKVWTSYEAHLAITKQILTNPVPSSAGTIDVPAALSQLSALFMLANQYGDHPLVQLVSVIRLTILFQNYEASDAISGADVDNALAEAEAILGLDGFDKQAPSPVENAAKNVSLDDAKAGSTTPGNAQNGVEQSITPFTSDSLAGAGKGVTANLKTPAFSFPTNPLGMNVYGAGQHQAAGGSTATVDNPVEVEELIPSYLRYLRVQTLMLGILWLTHSGESTRGSERLTLLHEMMDKLNDLAKTEGWASGNETGLIIIPLYSNAERSLRVQATHPRVLYQLTFVISAIAKRDCLGRKPKRKVFAQEGLRISGGDDPRASQGANSDILEGGSAFDFAPGLGLRDLHHAEESIAHIRATAYYELVSACLIRSEFEEAEQHLADLVSFVRARARPHTSQPSMWDQYASRVTLLYGHLAHALGQSQRALDCYRMVCFLEGDDTILWTMGRVGEIVLRIGAIANRTEQRGSGVEVETNEEHKHESRIWRVGEREQLVEMAAEVVDRCLNGGLGEHMAVVGRVIAASLSAEVVRAKQNLKSGLDLSCKSRDNYLRLLVLIFTAGQYLYTHTDYALTILETCRQLASSLGAVVAPAHKDTPPSAEQTPQYYVGHARVGLWIGQRFAELYKRRGASDKTAKQNAINTVFQKAVDAIELQARKTGAPSANLDFEDLSPARPSYELAESGAHSMQESKRPLKPPTILTSKSRARKHHASSTKDDRHDHTETSEYSQETTASYPPSSHVSERNHHPKRSATSYSRSSIGAHSQRMSVSSAGSRRSMRTRGDRKVYVESDDDDTGHKAMSEEDEFEGSEHEESDADVRL